MRVYLAVVRRGFRRYATYRAATLAGVFTNTIFGFISAHVFIALWASRPHIGGYDVEDALTFTFVGQALLAPVSAFTVGLDLPARIRTGDVAIDLYRPADFQLWWLAGDIGRAAYQFFARGLAPFIVGGLVFTLRVPTSPATWMAFAAAVVLAIVVSFAIRYLTALGSFWLLDDRGLQAMLSLATTFFSGMLLPLVLFPGWLGDLARALPFAAIVQVPADVFLGKHSGWSLAGILASQAGWAAALLAVGRIATRTAWRKVVVQGG